MIHITNGQSDQILDFITEKNFFSDTHRQSLKDNLETFEFTTFADKSFSEYLTKHNRVIIPAEDQGYIELIINEVLKYRDNSGLKAEVFADASYLTLKKAKVIDPQTFNEQTPTTAVSFATNGTEWRPGIIEGKGYRTFHIEEYTNPYAFLKRIATEFGLELRFRVEVSGGRVTGRYVDLLERIGEWRGREVEFGRDLIGIQRREKTDNIYTALKGLGPERDDDTRLEVIVTDEETLQRWGRPDPITGELQHWWDTYEPQTSDQEMTESRLRELTENELEKRVYEVVEYESTIADLENVPGIENKKIRFGDTIKIKDTKFNPPLYLKARVHTQERSIKDKSRKNVVLGDYIEYTEEQVQSVWLAMRAEIRRRLARMLITNIASTAGDTFKNGEGSTELTAEVFLSGDLVDEAGENYTYVWNKRDKNGIPLTGWNRSGKTITISAAEIDEKATYTVDVIQNTVMSIGRMTITNVYDGKNGEPGPQGVPGPSGEDGQTLYTWVKYADDEQGNGMSDYPVGKEYMGIAYNKTSPTKGTNPTDYTWAKTKGNQGIPGEPGADGTPRYNWVKYADDKNGNGMSDDPEGKRYLGLAYNKKSQTESNNASDYEWSLIYRSASDNLINNPATSKNIDGWSVSTDGTISIQTVDFMGEQVDVIESISTGNTQNYSKYFDVDPTKAYEVSAWFKVEFPNPSTHLYLGATSDPGIIEQALISDESWTDTTNFYFFYTSSSTFASDWVKITGYMLPTGFPAEKANGLGENNSRNMRFKSGIDRTRIRFLNWNNDGTPRKMWVAHPTVREVPDALLGDFNKKINEAYGHADVVSEAAYLDAIADAEAYLAANGLIKGRDYNGVSITNEDGFITARGDGLVRTVMNSTIGYVIQRRANKTSPWQDVLYFDTSGNLKFAGNLDGASGTFKGELRVNGTRGLTIINDVINNSYGNKIASVQGGDIYLGDDNDGSSMTLGSKRFSFHDGAGNSVTLSFSSGGINVSGNGIIINSLGRFHNDGGRTYLQGDDIRLTKFMSANYAPVRMGELQVFGRIINQDTYDTTTGANANMYVATNGYYARSTSARKYKEQIQPAGVDYTKILQIEPKSWFDRGEVERNNGSTEGLHRYYGAIADEFEEIGLPEYTVYDDETKEIENFNDRAWILLIPNINDMKEEVKTLKQENESLKERLEKLEQVIYAE
ncbi:hypothetical protein BN988_01593 [Oceanobacillus picturae]|uniref:Peptidase S74 domain-containing protein n=1 Tax=Oceanobacillus picturae TaxID=171693 RepID=W9AC98_9BACI|nr:phage tail spike protein [Oceanobacillus picturae]CDO03093.1 hypothetical protein BN988_01593 [Oceanobacillus picturae]